MDIGDAARGMQVEIEFGPRAAEAADIDDAALDLGRREVLVGDLPDTWSTMRSTPSIKRAAGRLCRSEYHDLFGHSCPEVY